MAYLAVYIIASCLDGLYVCWFRSATKGDAFTAAIAGAAIGGLSLSGTIFAVHNVRLGIPWVLGLGTGSYLATALLAKEKPGTK